MARIIWKENFLINLKLGDKLYTIGQLLYSPVMRLFNISNSDGVWKNINLNEVDILFEVNIGRVILQNLAKERIKDKSVKFSLAPCEKYYINPGINFDGGFVFKGGSLIKVDSGQCYTEAPIVINDLDVKKHKELIEKYELTNMWGDKDLAERLICFFETGERIPPLKKKVFPNL